MMHALVSLLFISIFICLVNAQFENNNTCAKKKLKCDEKYLKKKFVPENELPGCLCVAAERCREDLLRKFLNQMQHLSQSHTQSKTQLWCKNAVLAGINEMCASEKKDHIRDLLQQLHKNDMHIVMRHIQDTENTFYEDIVREIFPDAPNFRAAANQNSNRDPTGTRTTTATSSSLESVKTEPTNTVFEDHERVTPRRRVWYHDQVDSSYKLIQDTKDEDLTNLMAQIEAVRLEVLMRAISDKQHKLVRALRQKGVRRRHMLIKLYREKRWKEMGTLFSNIFTQPF